MFWNRSFQSLPLWAALSQNKDNCNTCSQIGQINYLQLLFAIAVPIDVQTTIPGLVCYWRKLKSATASGFMDSIDIGDNKILKWKSHGMSKCVHIWLSYDLIASISWVGATATDVLISGPKYNNFLLFSEHQRAPVPFTTCSIFASRLSLEKTKSLPANMSHLQVYLVTYTRCQLKPAASVEIYHL